MHSKNTPVVQVLLNQQSCDVSLGFYHASSSYSAEGKPHTVFDILLNCVYDDRSAKGFDPVYENLRNLVHKRIKTDIADGHTKLALWVREVRKVRKYLASLPGDLEQYIVDFLRPKAVRYVPKFLLITHFEGTLFQFYYCLFFKHFHTHHNMFVKMRIIDLFGQSTSR